MRKLLALAEDPAATEHEAQTYTAKATRRISRHAGAREVSLHLFGHRSDLERVELLFTSLLLQSATAPPRTLSGSGGRQGWAAGQRADLGSRRVGGGRTALGSGR